MNVEDFFCVIGLGKSGYSATKLLLKKNFKVKVTELNDTPAIRKRAYSLKKIGAEVEIGGHREEFYKGAILYVISPGIPKSNPVVRYIKKNKFPLISEIELAWMFSPARVIAVTGTNGKTSVSTYAYKILKAADISVYLAGNVGVPFSEIVSKLNSNDFVILEVSSFQLEDIINFRPFIAILLNISPDHMDRYNTFRDYIAAKFNIFRNQTKDDIAIIDSTQVGYYRRRKSIRAKIVDIAKLNLPELDSNRKFVYALGRKVGLDSRFLLREIKKLRKLKHRMEDLGYINGIRFINDSKATNPHATRWALRNINSEVILIAGGRDKNLEFKLVREDVARKVKVLILLGEARDKILTTLGGFVETIRTVSTLEEAVAFSLKEASSGDTVILSPMCASFDMFKSYEERGNKFKEIVSSYRKKCRN